MCTNVQSARRRLCRLPTSHKRRLFRLPAKCAIMYKCSWPCGAEHSTNKLRGCVSADRPTSHTRRLYRLPVSITRVHGVSTDCQLNVHECTIREEASLPTAKISRKAFQVTAFQSHTKENPSQELPMSNMQRTKVMSTSPYLLFPSHLLTLLHL